MFTKCSFHHHIDEHFSNVDRHFSLMIIITHTPYLKGMQVDKMIETQTHLFENLKIYQKRHKGQHKFVFVFTIAVVQLKK